MNRTLGFYYDISTLLFGKDSLATKWLEEKIAKTGRDDPVLADESQMLIVLFNLDQKP